MNSTNWPAPNVWVFIAQLVEHCSAKAEAMRSIPVEAPKTFFGLNCDCLNRNHNCDDHTFISFVLRFLSRSVNTHSPSGTRGLHYTTLARLSYSWMIPPRCCKHLVSLWGWSIWGFTAGSWRAFRWLCLRLMASSIRRFVGPHVELPLDHSFLSSLLCVSMGLQTDWIAFH